MSQKFKSDIETQAGLIDSFGFTGTAGQVLSSTGTKTEWITPPQSPGGGGSSQVFYFNGGTASSVGGYYQMSPVANTGTGADFTINANGYIASFLTDVASPNQLNIPAGNWNFEIYFSASSGGGSPSFYVELYKYSSSTFTLIASSSATPEGITNGTAIDLYITALAVPTTTLLATDRLAVRVYVTHSGRTIKMHTQNGHLSEVITTFSTGLTALNGLTEQVQYFSTGTVGTDFNIASAVNTHTFNLPTASATNRGALSSADWITFNSKANASGTTNYVSKFTGATTLGDSQIFDNGSGVGVNTSSPNYTTAGRGVIDINGSSQSMLALSVGGSGKGFLFHTGTDLLVSNEINGSIKLNTNGSEKAIITSAGNVGIGTSSPTAKLVINSGTSNQNALINGDKIGFSRTSDGAEVVYFKKDTSLGTEGTANINGYDGIQFRTQGAETVKVVITSSGNVGIGTTAPQAKLHINNGTDRNLWFRVNGSGTGTELLSINDAQSTRQSLAFSASSFYFDNGNVGIGTTTPTSPLHIVKSGGARINLGDSQNTVAISSIEEVGDSAMGFYTQTSIERMRITSSGDVGIGTTSPSEKLDVYGVIRGVYTADPGAVGAVTAKLLSYSPSPYGLVFRGYGSGTHSIQSQREANDAQIYPLSLQPNGGNVGIGTTSPTYKLQVVNSGNTLLQLNGNNTTGTIDTGFTISADDSKNIYLYQRENASTVFGTNNVERMRITSGGNVGIGTTTPTSKLHSVANLSGAGSYDSRCAIFGYNSSIDELYNNPIGVAGRVRIEGGIAIYGDTSNTGGWAGYFDGKGYFSENVGIGTTNPSQLLHVAGNARVAGAIYDSLDAPGSSGQILSSTNTGTKWITGGLGVHTLVKLSAGQSTSFSINSNTVGNMFGTANRLFTAPYIPANTITCSALYMNVNTTVAGGLARILIYSDNGGVPDTKIYESASLDCSTTGIKTATTTQTFIAGTTYWLCVHTSSAAGISCFNANVLIPIKMAGIVIQNGAYVTATFGSAPSTFGTPTYFNGNVPYVGITI